MKYQIDTKRPMSWSQISCFEWSREDWLKRYVLKEKQEESEAMKFGKKIGEEYPYELTFEREYKLQAVVAGIPLIGFIDAFDFKNKKLIELKTGKKWDKKKVDFHGQLDLYAAMLYIQDKINPEELDITLIWLATEESGSFDTQFIKGMQPVIFKVKKTMLDVVNILAKVKRIRKEMEEFLSTIEA